MADFVTNVCAGVRVCPHSFDSRESSGCLLWLRRLVLLLVLVQPRSRKHSRAIKTAAALSNVI